MDGPSGQFKYVKVVLLSPHDVRLNTRVPMTFQQHLEPLETRHTKQTQYLTQYLTPSI